MTHEELIDTWLERPSIEPCLLDALGIPFRASQLVGGVRLSHDGNMAIGAWVDPPSIWRDVAEPVLCDVIVFDPGTPEKFKGVTGEASMLGVHHLEDARWTSLAAPRRKKSLRVYRHPLSWLQAGGAGLCPLNPWRFASDVCWHPAMTLIAENAEHAQWLGRFLDRASRVAAPKVRVA